MQIKFTRQSWHTIGRSIAMAALLLIQGCINKHDPVDPYESYNRAMFKFNKVIDKAMVKPVSLIYSKVLPKPLQTGISNSFDNLLETAAAVNNLVQGDIQGASNSIWRFLLNSTIGIGGLLDVAQHMGFPKKQQDFGKTLYKLGDHNSPYIIIPFFGPSTIRDATAYLIDYSLLNALPHIEPVSLRNTLYGIQIVDFRARLFATEGFANAASFDEYIFIRNAFLQFRRAQLLGEDMYAEDTYGDEDDFYVE